MRWSLWVVLACACGGGTKTASPPVERVEAATPPPPDTLATDMPIIEGPVAGATMIVVKSEPSATHCGGRKIVVERTPDAAPPDELAQVYELEFPAGLDFDPDDEATRKESERRFKGFLTELNRAVDAAKVHVRPIFDDVKSTPEQRIVAAARWAQVMHRAAEVIARAEIPADVRTGEFAEDATAAFCDTVVEHVEPFVAEEARGRKLCGELVAQHGVHGWWDAVCVTRP